MARRASDARGVARASLPWGTSMIVHAVILVVLGVWALPAVLEGAARIVLDATARDLPSLDSAEALLANPETEPIYADPSTPPAPSVAELPPLAQQPLALEMLDATFTLRNRDVLPRASDLFRRVPGATGSGRLAGPQLRQAESVEQAVSGLGGDMRAKLDDGDLLAVWLFDASISLLNDRQRVAQQLEKVFAEIGARETDDKTVFLNASVAFGQRIESLVGPTAAEKRVIQSVRQVPIDSSGIENVVAAVQWAVNRYSNRRTGQMMLVIWTDESGDDLHMLESAIDFCRQRDVSVSVVGPTAMLGREFGTHAYVHPPTGTTHRLQVKKGPDAALPERLVLPYWYPITPGRLAFAARGAFRPGPPWQGGTQMEGLISGVGPWALVRLSQETGGSYTIFDRPADRGPFTLETMRPYLPDYHSAQEIESRLHYHPLRQAVLAAAAVTHGQAPAAPPQTMFFRKYYSPSDFRARLQALMKVELRRLQQSAATIEKALAPLEPDEIGQLYEGESRRWRAWYDLTRGRLLAMSVRHREYAMMAEALTARGTLGPDTNLILCGPSSELRSGEETIERATEAVRLLERCVKNNRDTPWQYLAQRELDDPLGIDFRQGKAVKAPPQPRYGRPTTPGPKISLPNL